MTDFLIKRDNLRDTHWDSIAEQPLADDHIRLKVEAFALTANNVTYATFGEAMKYWQFFPAKDGQFGRVPVWGFATIVQSKTDGIETGRRVYGYLPISDQFDVQPGKVSPESFIDAAAHRAELAAIYNTYVFTDADPSYSAAYEAQQMLFRPLFTTGWMIDDALMENGEEVPETVIISSASSKTALALAHCLKARGGVDAVALTSERNRAFVEDTGLYVRVRTYEDVDRLHARGLTAYVDFLGRPTLTADVHSALRDRIVRSMIIGVTDWEGNRAPIAIPGPTPELFFVPTYAADRAKQLGPAELNKRLGASLAGFYKASSQFVTPAHSSGQDAIQTIWNDTVEGAVNPATGHILSL